MLRVMLPVLSKKNGWLLYELGWLALLLCVNPVIYEWLFSLSIGSYFPDSPLYMMAADRLALGKFWVDGWGHVDQGVILLPVYPMLLHLVEMIGVGRFEAPLVVSAIFSILSPLLMYFLLRQSVDRRSSFFAVVAFVWSFGYLRYSTAALTESVFVFFQMLFFFTFSKYVTYGSEWKGVLFAFVLGVISSILSLTRPPGIVSVVPVVAYILFELRRSDGRDRFFCSSLLAYVVGLFILLLPFVFVTFYETGHFPGSQYFRKNEYVVSVAEPQLYSVDDYKSGDAPYESILQHRRDGYKLNGSATEMLGYLVDNNVKASSKYSGLLFRFYRNLVNNISEAKFLYGAILLLVFSVAVTGYGGVVNNKNAIVPICIVVYMIAYLVFVSLFSGGVGRYFEVLEGLVVVGVLRFLSDRYKNIKLLSCVAIAMIGISLYSLRAVDLKTITKWPSDQLIKKSSCQGLVANNEAVFSFVPLDAYLYGGVFRIVPNSDVDRMYAYAKLTGVNWLVISGAPGALTEIGRYQSWVWIRELLAGTGSVGHLVRRCEDVANSVRIYSFE